MSIISQDYGELSGGVYYKAVASVDSDTVNVGFEPSEIFLSFTHPQNLPITSTYSKEISTSASIQSYTQNGTTRTFVCSFSTLPSTTATISAVTSTGFTCNMLSQCSDIVIVAIP